MRPLRTLLVVVAMVTLHGVPSLQACNVPVFRYALERWKADGFEVVLFHEGPLTPELEQLVGKLRPTDNRGRPLANLRVTAVDLHRERDDALQQLWHRQTGAAPPWAVVRFPEALMLDAPVWAGKVDQASVEALLDSPARHELCRRLLSGQSIVWLVIESGDPDQDAAVVEMLDGELARLAATVQLPAELPSAGGVLQASTDHDEGLLSAIPLKIEFSVLRVSRQDSREGVFLATILQTDEGLAAESGPIVVPVFGRGRALQAFPGAGLDADTIRGAVEFLCGACSCSVKAQNPGMDLLLSADWEGVLVGGSPASAAAEAQPATPATEPVTATLVPIPSGRPPAEAAAAPLDETPAIRDGQQDPTPTSRTGARNQVVLIGTCVAGVLGALAVVTAVLRSGRRASTTSAGS